MTLRSHLLVAATVALVGCSGKSDKLDARKHASSSAEGPARAIFGPSIEVDSADAEGVAIAVDGSATNHVIPATVDGAVAGAKTATVSIDAATNVALPMSTDASTATNTAATDVEASVDCKHGSASGHQAPVTTTQLTGPMVPICSAADLLGVVTNLTGRYVLACDLDMTGVAWTPLAFSGIFDGAGHVISNFTLRDPQLANAALFKSNAGIIRNLTLRNVAVQGGSSAAALVAENCGIVANVVVDGGIVSATGFGVGGLVELNEGDVLSSRSNAAVTLTSTTTNAVVGGLVAESQPYSTITNSTSAGSVMVSSSQSNLNAMYVGGLVGIASAASVTSSSSAAAVDVTSKANGPLSLVTVGGLIGYSANASRLAQTSATGAVTVSADLDPVSSNYIAVGGLAGMSSSTGSSVADSFATGVVTVHSDRPARVGGLVGSNFADSSIASSFAAAKCVVMSLSGPSVAPTSAVGGLVGANNGHVDQSYWDAQVSQLAASAGGTGEATASMLDQSTYLGWDFAKTWSMPKQGGYPVLR